MTVYPELLDLLAQFPQLIAARTAIEQGYEILRQCFASGGKLLVCGNGGSAADSDHIAGELLKGFKSLRPIPRALDFASAGAQDAEHFYRSLQGGLPTIPLTGHMAYLTAWCNDVDPTMIFAQQVYVLSNAQDALLVLSTSGNSENIVNAVVAARAKGIRTVALTGVGESRLSALCDCCIRAPATEAYRVQEYHLPIYHAICAMLESYFFKDV